MLIKVLGVRRSAIGVKTSLRVWSPSFISPVACTASLLPPGAVFSLVSVSVARLFLRGGVAGPTPNPPLFSGLGTGRRFSKSIFHSEFKIDYGQDTLKQGMGQHI